MNAHVMLYYAIALRRLHYSLKYFSLRPEYGGSRASNEKCAEARKEILKEIKEIEKIIWLK